MARFRKVVCTTDFDTIAEGVFGPLLRADDILAAVEWTLAREIDFEDYPIVDDGELGTVRAFRSRSTPQHPACIFLFTVEGDEVHLLSVITADDPDTS